MKNYYKSLGVQQDAKDEDIKQAYKKLKAAEQENAKRTHELEEAYKHLIDNELRAQHDKFLAEQAASKQYVAISSDESDSLLDAYLNYLDQQVAAKKITPEMKEERAKQAKDLKNPILIFNNREEALAFVTEQAQKGKKFCLVEVGLNGLTGDYFFSDGDGILTHGKFAPETIATFCENRTTINNNPELKSQVDAALKSKDEDALKKILHTINPTQVMRTELSTIKSITPKMAPAPEKKKDDKEEQAARTRSAI